jgi:hypothetical protein
MPTLPILIISTQQVRVDALVDWVVLLYNPTLDFLALIQKLIS